MGKCPDWYNAMQAARYLGIPLPEIVNVPIWWIDKAITAMNAEMEAEAIKAQRRR